MKVEQEIELLKKKANARTKFEEKYKDLYVGLLNPELSHSERIKEKELKSTIFVCENDTGTWHEEPYFVSHDGKDDWQVEKIKYGECNVCGHPLMAEDYFRGEVVCEGCGTVVSQVTQDNKNGADRSLEALPEMEKVRDELIGLRKDEMELIWMERKRNAKIKSTNEKKVIPQKLYPRTDMKTYRRNQYLLALNSISSQLHMTQHQTDSVKNIIFDDRYKLKDFHSKAKDRTVIAGLCRFVIKTAGRSDGDLRYNLPAFRDNNLDKDKYEIIAMNIVKRGIMSLMR